MNILLLTSNKQRKSIEPLFKHTPHTVLGNEPAIKGSTVTRILDHYAPHIVVLLDDVQVKDGITRQDVIVLLKAKRPTLRVIYQASAAHLSIETLSFLAANQVYDILTDTQELTNLVDSPMTEADVKGMIEDLEEKKKAEEISEKLDDTPVLDMQHEDLHLSFPVVSLRDFDTESFQRTAADEAVEAPNMTIGIAQLQHHNGCTHTAFEIAALLQKEKTNCCIVLSDAETYKNLAAFHELDPERIGIGLQVHGIDVYPYEKLEEVQSEYSCTICDFSFLREDQQKVFSDMTMKLMLCSAAEWDIATTLRYVNYPNISYVRDIVYLFPRVSKPKFIGYNKQMMRAGCESYRLHPSEDWLSPCAENQAVYKHILSRYNLIPTTKKKRSLLRIKK